MRLCRAMIAVLVLAGPLSAEPTVCPDPLFQVSGGDPATRTRTCDVATEARTRLESCNIPLARKIEIEIVTGFEDEHASCLGLYHCGEDRIELLTPEGLTGARDRNGVFELISDDAYWDSVLVHELTHAAYDTVRCPYSACVATSEYAAYAMQVHLLPPEQQELFGKTVQLHSNPGRDAITEVMLYLSPDHFAKFVWLHFSSLDKPCDYMRAVMQGNVYFERQPF